MHGEYKMPGGKLVVIDLDVHAGQLANVQLSGDFFLEPDSALIAINAALEGRPADLTRSALTEVISAALTAETKMYGISPDAVAVAVERALGREHEA
ncbi:MAG: biotin--protein ligase [Rhodanobacter sp.]